MPESFADPPLLTDRFDAAVALALEHHRVHVRKGTAIPYVSHLMAVTGLVLEFGGGEDEAIAAVLHDAVEDGGGPMMLGRIRHRFGCRVATMVEQGSDTDEHPKPPWRDRKRKYLAGIATKDPGAVLVSLADKLHNARAITTDLGVRGEALWDRFSAPAEDTVAYYAALHAAFTGRLGDMPGFDERVLRIALNELDRLVDGMAESAGVDRRSAMASLLGDPLLD